MTAPYYPRRTLGPVEVEVLHAGDHASDGIVPAGCVTLQFGDAAGVFTYTASRATVRRLLDFARRELDEA